MSTSEMPDLSDGNMVKHLPENLQLKILSLVAGSAALAVKHIFPLTIKAKLPNIFFSSTLAKCSSEFLIL